MRALRLFRAGKLDEAPVPLGDIRATKLDPQLAGALRVRRLLAADAVVFEPGRSRARCASVYDDTADRADYQALVPEFEAPPAEDLAHQRPAEGASQAAIALREREEADPLAAAASRFVSSARSDPTLALRRDPARRGLARPRPRRRASAAAPTRASSASPRAYPRLAALHASGARRTLVVPIAWVGRCAPRLAARLHGWREDELGSVDYARVSVQTPGPEPTPVTSKRAVATAGDEHARTGSARRRSRSG